MMDRLKSLLLVVLIAGSLYQSYLLAYSSPKFDPIQQNDYVQTEPLGKPKEIGDMLFPDQIIVHMGNQQHSVLYPESYNYMRLLDNIKQRSFESFRRTTTFLANVDWEDVRTNEQGVEIRFRDGLPLNLLQMLLQIKGELPVDNDTITRIWIFASKGDVRTYFFTDSPSVSYEVIRADFTSKDVENFATYGDLSNLYRPMNSGDYYIPTKPVHTSSYAFTYSLLTADQLKGSLFVDPGITRNLKERDGSEIYTDGKRGFQIKSDKRWITYTDPVAPVESKNDILDNLLAGVQFINQHVGWDGNYVVARTPQRQSYSNQAFVFRQYYESFPIINPQTEGYGTIRLQVQKGIISGYERSMMMPDAKSATRRDAELMSGDALEERLQTYQRRSAVVSIFPAYRPVVSEQSMLLTPVWAIELRDGTYDFME